jgi:two-component system, NarL family, invasion response regulator UvrY
MNILIADDHGVLRTGLIQILAEGYPDAHFGEASTTPDTLDCLARQRWDVLVLDIFMPGRSGLDVLQHVRAHYPDMPVLVLSSAPEEQLATRVLKAGASGYLNKQAAPEELVGAIRKLRAGGRYVSVAMAERLAEEIGRVGQPPHEKLSDREYDVLRQLMTGRSVKDIAEELCLSPKTVSTYHTRIWEKLGVHNDVELIRYAIDHRLGTPDKAEGSLLDPQKAMGSRPAPRT